MIIVSIEWLGKSKGSLEVEQVFTLLKEWALGAHSLWPDTLQGEEVDPAQYDGTDFMTHMGGLNLSEELLEEWGR